MVFLGGLRSKMDRQVIAMVPFKALTILHNTCISIDTQREFATQTDALMRTSHLQ